MSFQLIKDRNLEFLKVHRSKAVNVNYEVCRDSVRVFRKLHRASSSLKEQVVRTTWRTQRENFREISNVNAKIRGKSKSWRQRKNNKLLRFEGFKNGAPVISVGFTHTINLFSSTGMVPTDWKTSRVVPLFKSGGREEMDNYRPISVLQVISKIAEKVVHHL